MYEPNIIKRLLTKAFNGVAVIIPSFNTANLAGKDGGDRWAKVLTSQWLGFQRSEYELSTITDNGLVKTTGSYKGFGARKKALKKGAEHCQSE